MLKESIMKVEVGREYKTRGGWKAKVISDDGSGFMQFCVEHDDGGNTILWHYDCGSAGKDLPIPEYDLISYWVEGPKTGEWIGWNGGECPVHPETVVQICYAEGLDKHVEAKFVDWQDDVVAYRVIKEYVEPKKPLDYWLYYSEGIEEWVSSNNEVDANDLHDLDASRFPVIHVREVI